MENQVSLETIRLALKKLGVGWQRANHICTVGVTKTILCGGLEIAVDKNDPDRHQHWRVTRCSRQRAVACICVSCQDAL